MFVFCFIVILEFFMFSIFYLFFILYVVKYRFRHPSRPLARNVDKPHVEPPLSSETLMAFCTEFGLKGYGISYY